MRHFIHPLFLRLFVQKHGILPFVVSWFFISEDVADKTVVGLLRVGSILVLFPLVEILKLFLQGVLDLYISFLFQTHISLSFQHIFLGLSLLGVVNYFVFEVFVS